MQMKNQSLDTEKLKYIIREKGFTAREFGKRIGVNHRQLVYERLNGRTAISVDEAFSIADVLGVKIEDLRK